ncbi:hypothetical protein GCM10018980_40960 [Streptomyces capoamus]|uniref:Uncharacterized protein n=1 Tax=Streptomyces capoamus TaxID=68183 RepID=A0A919C6J0_9ACTN|nr:hypothetical protein GCM10010501_49460 [Streptomyces libani subsp. rufus]GHG55644.1 hypothetical protein GCM10018980_40960 [Streptomyces capoamus]
MRKTFGAARAKSRRLREAPAAVIPVVGSTVVVEAPAEAETEVEAEAEAAVVCVVMCLT